MKQKPGFELRSTEPRVFASSSSADTDNGDYVQVVP